MEELPLNTRIFEALEQFDSGSDEFVEELVIALTDLLSDEQIDYIRNEL